MVTREGVSQVHMNGTKGKVLTNQTDVKVVDYHYRYVGSHTCYMIHLLLFAVVLSDLFVKFESKCMMSMWQMIKVLMWK